MKSSVEDFTGDRFMTAYFRSTAFCEKSGKFKTSTYSSRCFIIETYMFSDRELYIQLKPAHNQNIEKYTLLGKIKCASTGELCSLYAFDPYISSKRFLDVILSPNLLYCFHLPSVYEIHGDLNFYVNYDNLADLLKRSTVIVTPHAGVFGYDEVSYIEMNKNYIDVVYRSIPIKSFRADCNLLDIKQSNEKTSKLFRSLNYTVIKDLCASTSSIQHLQYRLFREFEYALDNFVTEDTYE